MTWCLWPVREPTCPWGCSQSPGECPGAGERTDQSCVTCGEELPPRRGGGQGSCGTNGHLSGEPAKEAVGLLTRSRSSKLACGPGREGTRTVTTGTAGLLPPHPCKPVPWGPGPPRFSFDTFVLGRSWAFPSGSADKESAGFDPGVGKMPWRRERLLTAVFCPGEKSQKGSERVRHD